MAKENKGLFTPTYNGITASVSFVSSTLAVLNSRLNEHEDSDAFSKH